MDISEQTFLILSALADQPRHGYALVTEVDEMTDGRIRLRAGTLYGALDRLVTQGLHRPRPRRGGEGGYAVSTD